MAKIHDIVETSKMSMEYDGSLIDVERTAKADLDNGRLAVRDGATYKYPADATVTALFLITTPEKTYTNVGLTEFYNKLGKKVRAVRVMLGDKFSTTAVPANVALGDVLMVNNTGSLIADVAGAIKFTVVEIKTMGGFLSAIVERTV